MTILVNGLPLVHVELKRRGIPIREAFNQIERYQRDSFWAGCGLFEYVQIFVISNGTNTKYYSNSTRFNAIKDAKKFGQKRRLSEKDDLLLPQGQKRRLSHDNPTFSFNLKSNTMKNTVQKYCFLTN